MLFNSFAFAIFFVIIYGLYWVLRGSYRRQNLLLLGASYLFYGWWDIRFLYLIVLSTLVDFWSSQCIGNLRIPVRERVKISLLALLSAFLFVTVQWNAISVTGSWIHPQVSVQWDQLLPSNMRGWWVIWVSLAGVGVYNLLTIITLRLRPERVRKFFLFFSVVVNLTILGVFKYFNFFVDSFLDLLNGLGFHTSFDVIRIILPVGISFFTFQTMSRTIDVYRGKLTAQASLIEVATYISFFPQLVAGPIERGAHLLPQFQRPRTLSWVEFKEGCWLTLWGLYKKMVVADNVSAIVNQTFGPFDSLASLSVPEDGLRLLVAIYAFAIQIYCDFSGYSDIARGTAKMMGFDIMVNFNNPYFAVDPSDFWKRWHISLSSWLRDYLYIPLGGNRNGVVQTYRNLFLTMVLGGLWHGASWTFVLWGVFHGSILILYRLLGINSPSSPRFHFGSLIRGMVMFHLVCFGWLLFRAQNLETVGIFLRSILWHPFGSSDAAQAFRTLLFYGGFLVLFQIVQGLTHSLNPLAKAPRFVRLNVYIFLVMSLLALAASGGHEFIYFAF
ncbi:MAG: MBOAT family protein [Phycisphaerae bacterium]|nr:MBOAT family protein [Phycisphaerae bacterium]